MKINTKKGIPKWFKFESGGESCDLYIRPFPHSRLADADVRVDAGGKATVGLSIEWLRFDACLQGWKGLTNENGDEFKYNVENKKSLFDYDDDIRNFVAGKISELDEHVELEIKN